MPMQRDTYKYELKDGKKVVYVGITNDPERREAQHRQEKNFGTMNIVGRASTREGAEQWETQRLETYMNNHKGDLPKYNQTATGK
jgi:predicted GIY-YIG superfamily endonuclease